LTTTPDQNHLPTGTNSATTTTAISQTSQTTLEEKSCIGGSSSNSCSINSVYDSVNNSVTVVLRSLATAAEATV